MDLRDYKTSATLLGRARDWADNQAWNEMFQRYNPLLERWSEKYLVNHADVAEVNQRVWVELTRSIISFRYDPGKSFRAWLRTQHRWRMHEFLRSRPPEIIDHEIATRFYNSLCTMHGSQWSPTTTVEPECGFVDQLETRLIELYGKVENRVTEKTWQIFWSIAMEKKGIGETAKIFEMTYAATFAAFTRVIKLLRDEALKD
ncbi:MAG: sigma-70 family RNA polymerase sigma factor [Planctomycetota bacterium]|nr:MAG: sigma-70 family RNA polymerase sigma factor [Planctomycetota bacterium]